MSGFKEHDETEEEPPKETMKRTLYVKGIQIAYYYICKTKLWYFSNGITMEDKSELVKIGKLLHDIRYKREQREVQIGSIAIDFYRNKEKGILEVHEVKKSEAFEVAHLMQVKYYLYFLAEKGVRNTVGYIHYPKIGKTVEVTLSEDDIKKIEEIQKEIGEIVVSNKPPDPIRGKYCRKCAYFELCWV